MNILAAFRVARALAANVDPLILRYMYKPGVYTVDEPNLVAKTDGVHVYLGPEYLNYSPKEQLFIYLHEILHILLGHIPRSKQTIGSTPSEYKHKIFNIAADCVINHALQTHNVQDSLYSYKLPEEAITFQKLKELVKKTHLDKLDRLTNLSVEEVYYRLCDCFEDGAFKSTFDTFLSWGEDLGVNTDLKPVECLQQPAATASSISSEFSQGQHYGVNSALHKLLVPHVKTNKPWQQELSNFLTPSVDTEPNWVFPHRRFLQGISPIWKPATKRKPVKRRIAFLFDTSGSCFSEQVVKIIIGELKKVKDTYDCTIEVVMFDTKVTNRISLTEENDIDQMVKDGKFEVIGGGGTSFVEALELADQLSCQDTVVLTDGIGEFPKAPCLNNVLWVLWTKVKPPFGNVAYI